MEKSLKKIVFRKRLRAFSASVWPKGPKIGFGDRFYEYLVTHSPDFEIFHL